MAHMIKVTIAGGAYLGPKENTPITINADKIVEITSTDGREIGTSVIKMEDNKKYWVTENQDELKELINKK
jgi:hypothetical protein